MSALHYLLPHPAKKTACGRPWSDRSIVTTGFAPLVNCKACVNAMRKKAARARDEEERKPTPPTPPT